MTGEVLAGRYRLERELGRGGMATVFLATDLRLSRPVALKRMHPGGGSGRAERFRREAELAASLRHPNVLEVHDFGEDGAQGPFLVCEWVQGEDLRALAGRLAPVPPEAAMVLGWELARALAAAHARGIVHRDVKPENVLVASGGPLKLADFGLAALEDQERLTSTGAVTGSLPYMAPERIDTGAFSPASDVYAVGVILFELCVGRTPHEGRGAAHLAASVMSKDAPSLSEFLPALPEPLVALVARCLARDPRDRPEDGAALDGALAEVLGRHVGPPAEVSRAFLGEPTTVAARWRRERFERLLAEGRALLSRGEGARAARVLNAALVLEPGSAEVMALLRERPRQPRWKGLAVGAGVAACVAAGWGVWAVRSGGEADSLAPGVGASSRGETAPVRSGAMSAMSGEDGRPTQEALGGAARGAAMGMGSSPAPGGERPAEGLARQGAAGDDARGRTGTGPSPSSGGTPEVGVVAEQEPASTPLAGALVEPSPSRVDASGAVTGTSASRVGTSDLGVAAGQDPSRVGPSSAVVSPVGTSDLRTVRGAPSPRDAARGTERVRGARPETTGAAADGSATPSRTDSPKGTQPGAANLATSGVGASPTASVSEPARPGVLRVTARPWAEVFVDGASRGYTPRVRDLSLPAGTYRLRFAHPLCDAVELDVTLAPGETVARDVTLTPRRAELVVVAPAGARLFLDGREVGVAPLAAPLSVEHGRHTLTARAPGVPVLQREVDVVAGRRMNVTLEVTP
ncbi:protein kinase [Myxococcus sp. K15C18031901]|uniref:serine/threonine-protein kinase n=1 Tax=Myxococcus dinghuensis TaxID=2906761 RepID=UPI0020A7698A|nr:serine/threonine-protein kinase [Myxococcus dinghuensis]MCP3101034.1 protein kinase [Myxococcus dinghuensis]